MKLRTHLVTAITIIAGLAWWNAAQAQTPVTYKLFGREVGGYSSKDDLPGIVNKELGPGASIVDWNEIKKQFGGSEADLKTFCDKLGLPPEGQAWVTLDGKAFWQEERRYFIYRADHHPPEDFLAHDQLQNNLLLLGSWYGTRPVLVKITEFNSADAAQWTKWDEMLAARKTAASAKCKEIAGVYTLVAANGKKVPTTVVDSGHEMQLRSGSFTINADGTCTSRMTVVPPSAQNEVTVDTSATYTLGGRQLNVLNMQWKGAGQTDGTVAGNIFTMENEGIVYSYKK